MEKAQEILARFPGEWVAIEITEDDESGDAEGKLIFHSSCEAEVWDKIYRDPRLIFVGYSGPALVKGIDGILMCVSTASVGQ